MQTILLAVALAVTWVLFSGHLEPFFLVMGAASCVLVLVVAKRMYRDPEPHTPIYANIRAIPYILWLAKEIVLAAMNVILTVLKPRMNISPTVGWVKSSQKMDAGKVMYANSITMTPGTVSLSVDGDYIEVHALQNASLKELKKGEMDKKVTATER